MKALFRKIVRILSGRVARNVYFWLFFLSSTISLRGLKLVFALILLALMMLQVYFNNLVLVPRLLVKKKYLLYFISVFAYTAAVAYAYTITLTQMFHYLPFTSPNEVSHIMVNPSLSDYSTFNAVLRQWATNYTILLIMTLIFTMGWYMMDYARQQKILEEANKKQTETELLFLKGQINPHFLFNTLNNLYALAVKKADQTPDAIMKLSAILRYLLYESDTKEVSFEKEKEIMQAYIDLELLRLSNKDNLHFSVTADGSYSMPPLLWLPVLENVFKHGTRFIADNYFIDYRFTILDGKIIIHSTNNYKPLVQGSGVETGGGIGLNNLRQRLNILYPGKHTITTNSVNDTYITNVEISLK